MKPLFPFLIRRVLCLPNLQAAAKECLCFSCECNLVRRSSHQTAEALPRPLFLMLWRHVVSIPIVIKSFACNFLSFIIKLSLLYIYFYASFQLTACFLSLMKFLYIPSCSISSS